MEEIIETRVSPDKVWQAWERGIEKGQSGDSKFRYQVLEIRKGEGFSVLWKTLFVRLIFSHTVKATSTGSKISYRVQIKGFFSLPVRWLLGKKIRNNLSMVLRSVVRQLEQ